MKKKISIIICTYQAEQHIKRCISELKNVITDEIEVIFVNDGSTDKTQKIIKNSNLKNLVLINMKYNQGPSVARNIGIKKSKGKYIAILDSDDTSHKDRLKLQSQFLDNNPLYSVVGSNVNVIKNEKKSSSIRPRSDKQIRSAIFSYFCFCHSSIMYRRSAYNKTKKYDSKILYGEDYRLVAELMKYGKVYNLRKFLVTKYETNYNLTSKISTLQFIKYALINRIYVARVLNAGIKDYFLCFLGIIVVTVCKIFNLDKEKIRKYLKK